MPRRMRPRRTVITAVRENLARIQPVLRRKGLPHPLHCRQIRIRINQRHKLLLLQPDAVFPAQRPPQRGAFRHQLRRRRHRLVHHPRRPRVKKHTRMQIAVPGVEHIGDDNPVPLAHLRHLPQHLRQPGARHHPVHQIVIWRNAPEGAEGRLAAHPQPFPFRIVLCHPHLGGSGVPQRRRHFLAHLRHLLL